MMQAFKIAKVCQRRDEVRAKFHERGSEEEIGTTRGYDEVSEVKTLSEVRTVRSRDIFDSTF